ncbi:MAG: hypothetical protein ACLFRI_07100 [Candidatus Izemoplasmataceae bacterium]
MNPKTLDKIIRISYLEKKESFELSSNLRHVPSNNLFKVKKKLRKALSDLSDEELIELKLLVKLAHNLKSITKESFYAMIEKERIYFERQDTITYILRNEHLHDDLLEGIRLIK